MKILQIEICSTFLWGKLVGSKWQCGTIAMLNVIFMLFKKVGIRFDAYVKLNVLVTKDIRIFFRVCFPRLILSSIEFNSVQLWTILLHSHISIYFSLMHFNSIQLFYAKENKHQILLPPSFFICYILPFRGVSIYLLHLQIFPYIIHRSHTLFTNLSSLPS